MNPSPGLITEPQAQDLPIIGGNSAAIMTERPHFPPIFQPYAITADLDPIDQAVDMAEKGTDAGTLLWNTRQDAYECAIVLAPEYPLLDSLPIVLVAGLGLGNALGALVPPVVAVTFGWPDRIEINGGVVGSVRIVLAKTPNPNAIPDWLVIGFHLANSGHWKPKDAAGRQMTTLAAEGCKIDILDLLEAFSRHFLAWINRWQSDGMQPVQQAWMSRTLDAGKHLSIDVDGVRSEGKFKGLNDQGGLELVAEGRQQVVPLDIVLPSV